MTSEPAIGWLLLCVLASAWSAATVLRALQNFESTRAGALAAPAGLPPAWRLFLPLLRRCEWFAGPMLRPQAKQVLAAQLRRADLDHLLDPVLVRAAQCCAAASALCIVLALALRLDETWAFWGGGWSVALAWRWPGISLAMRARQRAERMLADVPLALEMLALCMAGGQHFNGALQQVLRHLPQGALQESLSRTWAEIRQGRPRVAAMRALGQRTGVFPLQRLAAALAQADALGMALAPLLRTLAQQYQMQRFQQAEKQAMEAPVKMLLPLVVCFLPATFLVLAYPLAHYLSTGLFGI